MGAPIIDDELWALIEPLLPPQEIPRAAPGFQSGCAERHPVRIQDPDTLVRSLDRAGVRLRADLLEAFARLAKGRRVERIARAVAREVTRGRGTRFVTGSGRFILGASRRGGRRTGPNRTDLSRPGSKHHILVGANGVPISAILTGANRNDVTQLLPLVDAIPPVRGVRGRPLRKPKVIYADRGYDSQPHRERLRARNPTGDRQAPYGTWQRTRQIPLGGRAFSRMAAHFPSSSHSL